MPVKVEDRPFGQCRVTAAVVEVQMTVDHHRDVLDPHLDISESSRQRRPSGAVVGLDVGVCAHPRVQKYKPVGMLNRVAKTRLDPGSTRPGVLRRPDEVPEVDPTNYKIRRRPSVSLTERPAEHVRG